MNVSKLKVDGKVYNIKDSDARKKLESIDDGANNYTHPNDSGNKHIPSGGSTGEILIWENDGTATWGNVENTWRPIAGIFAYPSISENREQTEKMAFSVYGAWELYIGFQNKINGVDSRVASLESRYEVGIWTPEKNPSAIVPYEYVQASGSVQNPGSYVINGKIVTLTTIAQVLDDDTISNEYSKVHVQVSSFPFVPKNIIAASFIQNTATAYDTGFKMINYGQTIESKDSFVFDWEGKQTTRVNVTIQYTI